MTAMKSMIPARHGFYVLLYTRHINTYHARAIEGWGQAEDAIKPLVVECGWTLTTPDEIDGDSEICGVFYSTELFEGTKGKTQLSEEEIGQFSNMIAQYYAY